MNIGFQSKQIKSGNKSDLTIIMVAMEVRNKNVFYFTESNSVSSELNLGSFSAID